MLDKHGRENASTPKDWKAGYHDLTPKAAKEAAVNGDGSAGDGDQPAAAEAPAADAGEGEGEKKKKKKDKKVCAGWLLLVCLTGRGSENCLVVRRRTGAARPPPSVASLSCWGVRLEERLF